MISTPFYLLFRPELKIVYDEYILNSYLLRVKVLIALRSYILGAFLYIFLSLSYTLDLTSILLLNPLVVKVELSFNINLELPCKVGVGSVTLTIFDLGKESYPRIAVYIMVFPIA